MEEFAAAVGIARPTVSEFLQDPEGVRPASRERIRKAMQVVNDRSNGFAVNFNRRSTKTTDVVAPSFADPFCAEVVRRVEVGALEAGCWSIESTSHADGTLEARALQVLASIKAAGILIAPLG